MKYIRRFVWLYILYISANVIVSINNSLGPRPGGMFNYKCETCFQWVDILHVTGSGGLIGHLAAVIVATIFGLVIYLLVMAEYED